MNDVTDWTKEGRQPFQFSIRTFGVVVALSCIVAAWIGKQPYFDAQITRIEFNESAGEIQLWWDVSTTHFKVRYEIYLGDESGQPISTTRMHPGRIEQSKEDNFQQLNYRGDFDRRTPLYSQDVGTELTWKRPLVLFKKGEPLRVTSTPLRLIRIIGPKGKPFYYWIQTK